MLLETMWTADLAGSWETSGVDMSPSLAGHSWAYWANQDMEMNDEATILRRESYPPTKLPPRTGAHIQVLPHPLNMYRVFS